jgi:hypothetical protein
MTNTDNIRIISRIGVFGTFFGHGLLALSVHLKWIPLLTGYGFSTQQAMQLLPLIGMLDIAVAFVILIYPVRIVLMWAVFWTFLTALSRPISGDGIIEFVERSANWTLPLLLLMLQGFPRTARAAFKITDRVHEKKNRPWVRTV